MDSASSMGTDVYRRKSSSLKNCAKCVFESIRHFGSYTSIHGCKYAFQPGRRLVERFIFVASVTVCAAGAAILVYTSLEKFYKNPTITTIRSFIHQTYELPFPAVTFCNVNLVFRYKAEILIQRLKIPEYINVTRERLEEILPNVSVLLHPQIHIDDKTQYELSTLQHIFDANNMSTTTVARMLSQSCDDMVERCSWNGVLIDCNLNFQETTTYSGYCCSFNYVENTNWTGHPDKDPYKLRSYEYGPETGLRVLLNPMGEDYMRGIFMATGFSVTVGRSGLHPRRSQLFIGQSDKYIRIAPVFTDSNFKLKTVQPERRGCTFFNERTLKTSKTYSRETCALECRAQAVLSLCGCVPFYYIEQASLSMKLREYSLGPSFNNSLDSCNLNHLNCLRKHSSEIESERTTNKCHCWSQCTILSYDVSIRESNLEAVKHYVGDFFDGVNTSGRVSVNVFFASQVSRLINRDIIYTIEQLMSNLGGIFSLFLGCSFLSVTEVLFYSLLRIPKLCSRIWKDSI